MKDKTIKTQIALCTELCKFKIPDVNPCGRSQKTPQEKAQALIYLVFNENNTPVGYIFKEQLLKTQIHGVRAGRRYRYELLKAPLEALAKMPNVCEDMLCPLAP